MTIETIESDSTPQAAPRKIMPPIVSMKEWQAARSQLLVQEKAHMRAGDALAAERRRLPMVEIETKYEFDSPEGKVSLLDLFEGRHQLIIYHFMFAPEWDEGCVGCSMFVDNMGHPAHLNARDISRVLVSRAPLAKITPFKERMGWTEPWVSSFGSDFNVAFGATVNGEEDHIVSVLLRDGDRIFRTYSTGGRGCEPLTTTFTYLDLVPLGRQEQWEASPEGWPQEAPYGWWRLHDRYAGAKPETDGCCH